MDKLKDSTGDGKTISRAYMGRTGSGPAFHVNSGSGRVGSLQLWVGLSQLKNIGPTSNSVMAGYLSADVAIMFVDKSSSRHLAAFVGVRLGLFEHSTEGESVR